MASIKRRAAAMKETEHKKTPACGSVSGPGWPRCSAGVPLQGTLDPQSPGHRHGQRPAELRADHGSRGMPRGFLPVTRRRLFSRRIRGVPNLADGLESVPDLGTRTRTCVRGRAGRFFAISFAHYIPGRCLQLLLAALSILMSIAVHWSLAPLGSMRRIRCRAFYADSGPSFFLLLPVRPSNAFRCSLVVMFLSGCAMLVHTVSAHGRSHVLSWPFSWRDRDCGAIAA